LKKKAFLIPFDAQDQVDRQREELIANVPASGLL